MDKLSYGAFDPSNADIAFSAANGYPDPSSELETRKQLSYPLKEVKDYINKTIPVNSSDKAVQLVVSSENKLQYRAEPEGELVDLITGPPNVPSHVHGNITNEGAITVDKSTLATGDKLLISDSAGSNAIKRGPSIDTTSTDKFLRNDGTWAIPAGCDYANIVETYDTGLTWEGATHTIENDGWLRISVTSSHRTFAIDDTQIPRDADSRMLYPVRKGQVFKSISYYGFGNENDGKMVYVIYGLK